tara:strand:+ start:434 stop:580 length:147 start_codon:yes stop_codon:yes gene_type:complete
METLTDHNYVNATIINIHVAKKAIPEIITVVFDAFSARVSHIIKKTKK